MSNHYYVLAVGGARLHLATAPYAPTNVGIITDSPSEITLTWDLGDDADTQVIIERQTGEQPFQTLAELPNGENILSDTSCWASTVYSYRIKARNTFGDSQYSPTVAATTQDIPVGAMAIVTDLRAVANSPTTATITFTDTNTTASSYGYFVERSSDGMYYSIVASNGTSTSLSDAGLTPGSTYYYRVLGVSTSIAASDYTSPATLVMPARTAGYPVEPSGLQAVDQGAGSVLITWTNSDLESPQFEVYRAVVNPFYPSTTWSWTLITTTSDGTTSYLDTGLSYEAAYGYRVRALNGTGTSDYAAPADDYQLSMNGEAVAVCTCSAGTGSPKVVDIGPGHTYTSINAFDWTTLGPGDTLNIHYQTDGYHEFFQISTRGTPAAWITINGVPDNSGNLPIIDGQNAVLAPQFENHYLPASGAGGVQIGARAGYVSGYKPGYIVIQNLQIQNFYQGDNPDSPNTYTSYDDSTQPYTDNSGIYLERCDHVTVQNCTVTSNNQGIFGAGQGGFDRIMTDLLFDGNHVYNNGILNAAYYHNSYVEAVNVTYQHCLFEPSRQNNGTGIKDRSVNTVVRYNYIVGSAHQLTIIVRLSCFQGPPKHNRQQKLRIPA